MLPLTLGDPPCQATTTVKFLIVDALLAYNILLGRPFLNVVRAIPSAYHMVVKFPTENEVGMVRGDQRVARECYLTSMKQKAVDNIHMDELDMRDELNTLPMPSKELEPVQLDDQPKHLAYIGSKLAEDAKDLLIHFLKQNVEEFAWKQEDMEGIDPAVITYKLNVTPSFKPVKQKRRSFAPKRQKAIDEEVSKLLQARAIREVDYPDWLVNVVLVKKANGKWRLCIDFTDVNRAYPKDSFPLPRIDLIMDITAGHEFLSFMDAFSSYNQIRLDPNYQEKTSFVTGQGTYCYQVMLFWVQESGGAVYQKSTRLGRALGGYMKHQTSKHVSKILYFYFRELQLFQKVTMSKTALCKQSLKAKTTRKRKEKPGKEKRWEERYSIRNGP